jgi:hypothetical protein
MLITLELACVALFHKTEPLSGLPEVADVFALYKK